ncbi:2-oxoacid:acceptor oxidoreductase family protein [Selenomonas sp.]|uniref:2-oxoacid:acceptor oxidoreductase family protein n=1 Tax=Selenomonas sp. TaxID=2053611 RepID=UPI0025F38FB6|nr:2-oxoacid:acceptor oxidoreductase family protein [Selenomonas sp.]MCI6086556.1 2-oxoacid:acceptor oxidoreductase family protein [Selenomonas sp.]MDY3298202.1 2-oxoacid:acceptor oxidoreductase family protein [Selenomonas sp.]
MRKQLRFSGSGGQGVITAAIIFAEAAVAEGKEAVQSQSYGPEARGGASKAEVIIDDAPIYHPHVEVPDIVLAMTQKAADKYVTDLNPDGILVLDEELVPEPPAFPHTVRVPITKLAIEEIGKPLFANIVALGAITHLTGLVSFDQVKESVSHRVPPHTVEQNMKALQVGWDAVDGK